MKKHRLLVAIFASLALTGWSQDSAIIVESYSDGLNSSGFSQVEGKWTESESKSTAQGVKATKALFNNADTEPAVARFTPDLPAAGKYQVFITYPTSANASDVIYRVHSAEGDTTTAITQFGRDLGHLPAADIWYSLGAYTFDAGKGGYVEISDPLTGKRPLESEANARIYADAVKFVPEDGTVAAAPPPPAITETTVTTTVVADAAPVAPVSTGTEMQPLPGAAIPAAIPSLPDSQPVAPPPGQIPALPGSPGASTDMPLPSAPAVPAQPPALPAFVPAATPAAPGQVPSLPGAPSAPGQLPSLPAAPGAAPEMPALPASPGSAAQLPALPGAATPVPGAGLPSLPSTTPVAGAAAMPSLPLAPPAGLPSLPPAPADNQAAALPGLPDAPPAAPAPPALPNLPSLAAVTPTPERTLPSPSDTPVPGALTSMPGGVLGNLPPMPTPAPFAPGLAIPTPIASPSVAASAGATPAAMPLGYSITQYNPSNLPWMYDFGAALKSARDQNKKVLVFFTAEQNKAAQSYETEMFNDPTVKQELSKYVLVKSDFPRNTRVAYNLGVFGAGVIVVVNTDGVVTSRIVQKPLDSAALITQLASTKPVRETPVPVPQSGPDNSAATVPGTQPDNAGTTSDMTAMPGGLPGAEQPAMPPAVPAAPAEMAVPGGLPTLPTLPGAPDAAAPAAPAPADAGDPAAAMPDLPM